MLRVPLAAVLVPLVRRRRCWARIGALLIVGLAAAACAATGDGSGELGRDPVSGREAPAREVPPRAPDVSVPPPETSPPRPDDSARVSEASPAAAAAGRGDGGGLGECAGVEAACGFVSVSLGPRSRLRVAGGRRVGVLGRVRFALLCCRGGRSGGVRGDGPGGSSAAAGAVQRGGRRFELRVRRARGGRIGVLVVVQRAGLGSLGVDVRGSLAGGAAGGRVHGGERGGGFSVRDPRQRGGVLLAGCVRYGQSPPDSAVAGGCVRVGVGW